MAVLWRLRSEVGKVAAVWLLEPLWVGKFKIIPRDQQRGWLRNSGRLVVSVACL